MWVHMSWWRIATRLQLNIITTSSQHCDSCPHSPSPHYPLSNPADQTLSLRSLLARHSDTTIAMMLRSTMDSHHPPHTHMTDKDMDRILPAVHNSPWTVTIIMVRSTISSTNTPSPCHHCLQTLVSPIPTQSSVRRHRILLLLVSSMALFHAHCKLNSLTCQTDITLRPPPKV